MSAFLIENSHWLWICLGLVLIASEVLGGAGYLFVSGSAALLVAMLAYMQPELALTWQLTLFTVLALGASVLWTRYFRRRGSESENPALGTHGAELVGRVLTLEHPLTDGYGRVRLADANWKVKEAQARSLAAGSKVRIVAAHGGELQVEPLNGAQQVTDA